MYQVIIQVILVGSCGLGSNNAGCASEQSIVNTSNWPILTSVNIDGYRVGHRGYRRVYLFCQCDQCRQCDQCVTKVKQGTIWRDHIKRYSAYVSIVQPSHLLDRIYFSDESHIIKTLYQRRVTYYDIGPDLARDRILGCMLPVFILGLGHIVASVSSVFTTSKLESYYY